MRFLLSNRFMLAVSFAVILGHGPFLFSLGRSADVKTDQRIPTVGDDHGYQKLAVNLIAGYGYTESEVLPLEVYQLDLSTPWGRDVLDRQARQQGPTVPVYDFVRAPGLPVLLASVYTVFGVRTIVAREMMAALLLLTALSLVLLGANFGILGTVAGFVTGLYHLYFFPGTHDFVRILTELPTACFVALFCALFALYLTGRRVALIPAALAMTCAVLTRVNLASAALFIALYLLRPRRQIRDALVFMLVVGAPLLAWSIYASYVSGRPVLLSTQGEELFAMTNNIDTLEGIGPRRWNQGGWNPGFVISQDGSIESTNRYVPKPGENGWVMGLRFFRQHWRDVPRLIYVKFRVGFWFNDGTSVNRLQPERLHLLAIGFLLLGIGLRPGATLNPHQSRRFLVIQLLLVLSLLLLFERPFWIVLAIWSLVTGIAVCRPYGEAYQPPFQPPTWLLALVLSHSLTTVVFYGVRMHHPLDPPLMYIALLGLIVVGSEIWRQWLVFRWLSNFTLRWPTAVWGVSSVYARGLARRLALWANSPVWRKPASPISTSTYPGRSSRVFQGISFASRARPWRTYATAATLVLILGSAAWMRVQFFRSFPDPFASPDTGSYLTGTYSLLQEGRFELSSVRTPLLSLLVYALLQAFGTYAAVTIFQGALTLASCVAIFATVRSFGGPWRLAALGAAALLGFNAHLFFWEHHLLTEACYSALLVGTLCSTASTIRAPSRWRATLAGLFAALTVLTRPQGAFLIPLVIAVVAWGGRGLGRRRVLCLSGAALIAPFLLIGGWCLRNAVVHGFFGLTDLGPSQMFGVTARWVDLERPTFLEAKGVIRPHIERYQHMSDNVNWVQYAADGPEAALNKYYQGDRKQLNADLAGLAREVIIYRPIPFIRRGLETTIMMLRSTPNRSGCNYQCMKSWDRFWEELNRNRPVDHHRASLNTARYPPKMRAAIFNKRVRPFFARETFFIRFSLAAVLLTFLFLPALDSQRRLAAGLAAVVAVLQAFTAGFFSEPAERYLASLHGAVALGFGLAVPWFAAYLATLVAKFQRVRVTG